MRFSFVYFSLWIAFVTTGSSFASPSPQHLRDTSSPTGWSLYRRDIGDVLSMIGNWLYNHLMPGSDKIPTVQDIKDHFLLNDTYINSLPVQLLTFPTYANWTGQNWNLRLHGATYKQPMPANDSLDDYARIFIPSLDQKSFNQSMRDNSRNMTAALLALPQDDLSVAFDIYYNGQSVQKINFPYATNNAGEFDAWVSLTTNAIPSGSGAAGTQGAVLYGDLQNGGAQNGNASAYFVGQMGTTVVADIDDVLRLTKIYVPQIGLANTFAYDYRVWDSMNEVLWNWQRNNAALHFHYLTSTPEQAARKYMDFIYAHYPYGSFDMRPFNFTSVDQTVAVKKVNLMRIFQTFPQRKFVLLGDTSNFDIMDQYPEIAQMFPDQVQCIMIRNDSATDTQMKFPYDTDKFADIDSNKWFFFRTAADIASVDISNGGCRNPNVPQNVTFGWQEIPSISDLSTILSASDGFSLRFDLKRGQGWLLVMSTAVLATLVSLFLV